jgi:hypothetical protein
MKNIVYQIKLFIRTSYCRVIIHGEDECEQSSDNVGYEIIVGKQ